MAKTVGLTFVEKASKKKPVSTTNKEAIKGEKKEE